MAKTLAVCNHKGGVGKTTTAVNMGAALAARGLRVLLVDMDAQANLTDTLRISVEDGGDVYALLKGTATGLPKAVEVNAGVSLDAVPATLELATAEIELSTAIGREQLLRDALEAWQPLYDYILIDTAPTLGLLTINAMAAADAVLIPLQAEYYALKGVKGLVDVITNVQRRINRRLCIGGVIITQYDTRTTLHKQIRDAIAAQFGAALYDTPVRNCIAIAEAQAKGSNIFAYAPDSAGAEDYGKIVDEFIKRNGGVTA